MKVLVTGATGQLGCDVLKELQTRGIECLGIGSAAFDITDFMAAQQFIRKYYPSVIVHCAAYTAVDKAEVEAERCYAVNVIGTENIAKICDEMDAKMIYISTDYVFSGEGEGFFAVDDQPAPVNVYGKSKLAGEAVVRKILHKYFIVRISWVFGSNGNNFVKTMLKLSQTHKELKVVADQFGSPTYTADLAKLLCTMLATDKYGVYHATNEGSCSWAEFAQEVLRQAGKATAIIFITSGEYPTKARRPLNSRLSKSSLDTAGFYRLPAWKDAVSRYLGEWLDE